MAASRSPLRILITGEDPLASAGLAGLLATAVGLEVTGPVPAGPDVVALAAELRAQVVAWDLGPGVAAGLERLATVARAGVPVVALVADGVAAAAAIDAGARSVLSRTVTTARLVAALTAAAQGLAVLDEGLAPALLRAPRASRSLAEALTPREHEVLQLVAEGLPNKLIADRLGISEHTAKFHVTSILGKLGVQGRTEAVVQAMRLGLVAI